VARLPRNVRVEGGLFNITFPVFSVLCFGAACGFGIAGWRSSCPSVLWKENGYENRYHISQLRRGRFMKNATKGRIRFHTTILQAGKTATGIQVPDKIIEKLGSSKRPAVRITINGTPTAAPWR